MKVLKKLSQKVHFPHYGNIDIQSSYLAGEANSFIIQPVTMFLVTCLVIVVFSYPAIAILSNPNGIEGVIGYVLGSFCINTGYCQFSTLLPAFALANIILIDLIIFSLFSVLGLIERQYGIKQDIENSVDDLGDELNNRFEDLSERLDQPKVSEYESALQAIYDLAVSEDGGNRNEYIKKIAGETLGYLEVKEEGEECKK